MRRLTIDLDKLESAFNFESYDMPSYLDTETGDVLLVPREYSDELEALYEELWASGKMDALYEELEAPGEPPIVALIQSQDVPDWHKAMLLDAYAVESAPLGRFVEVPELSSHEAYEDMESWVVSLEESRVRRRLDQALRGKKPFRSFKEALAANPQERERWFAFRSTRLRERILDWLKSLDIEPVEPDGDSATTEGSRC